MFKNLDLVRMKLLEYHMNSHLLLAKEYALPEGDLCRTIFLEDL